MAIVHLIDQAYEIAQKEYKDGTFSFNQLYTQLNSKANANSHQQSIGEVYCELLQDPRFTYIGDKKWRLREFLSDDQINNISESLYDIQVEGNTDENKTKSIIEKEIDEEFDEAAEENETNSEM